jgi:hypothetical protein
MAVAAMAAVVVAVEMVESIIPAASNDSADVR